ncbi:MAG: hypothetical protein H0X72_13660 [Acidobacteria bacterium]|nr:hypothetical protein [Acidobacteriota bacterium]
MKLYLMQIATLQPGDIPVAAYIVRTGDGKNILIDSGFPESFVQNPVKMKFRAAEPRGIKRKDSVDLNHLLRLDF